MPVTTVAVGFLLIPIKLTLSPTLQVPYSIVPVTTVPLPEMFMALSTDIKKGLSLSLTGIGIFLSKAATSFSIACSPKTGSVPYRAQRALPLMKTALSPSYSYEVRSSLTSISTSSCISVSVTKSHLLRNTTIVFTPTCLHNKMCSLV